MELFLTVAKSLCDFILTMCAIAGFCCIMKKLDKISDKLEDKP